MFLQRLWVGVRCFALLQLSIVCWAVALSERALAQSLPIEDARDFDANRFRMSSHPSGVIIVEPGRVLEKGAWYHQALAHYFEDALVLFQPSTGVEARLLADRYTLHLSSSLGLGNGWSLGAHIPVIVSQHRGSRVTNAPPTGFGLSTIAGFGLGQGALISKWRFWQSIPSGQDAAFSLRLTLPSMTDRSSYLGEQDPSLLAEFAWSQEMGRWRLAANAGTLWRRSQTVADQRLHVGPEGIGRIGVSYAVSDRFTWLPQELNLAAEYFRALLDPFSSSDGSDSGAELMFAGRWGLGAKFRFLAGGAMSVNNGYRVPVYRLYAGLEMHTQRPKAAPALPVVKPETSPQVIKVDCEHTQDGSNCRREVHAASTPAEMCNAEKNRACRRALMFRFEACRFVPSVRFYFEIGLASLEDRSDALVLDLAQWLEWNPAQHVALYGHADDSGPEDYNMSLSYLRAEAVKQALMKKGVDASRLHVQGFGERQPVMKGVGPKHRAKNRRVEVELWHCSAKE